jgi:hypothetical protein
MLQLICEYGYLQRTYSLAYTHIPMSLSCLETLLEIIVISVPLSHCAECFQDFWFWKHEIVRHGQIRQAVDILALLHAFWPEIALPEVWEGTFP